MIHCHHAIAGADFSIDWHTVDGGGGYSAGGDFEIEGTIGQPDAAFMAGGGFELAGGFWAVAPSLLCNPIPTDLSEFGNFANCLGGPDGGLDPGCDCSDFDADSDVDLADFAELQVAFTAP